MKKNKQEFGVRIFEIREESCTLKDFNVPDINEFENKIKIGLGFSFAFENEKEQLKALMQVSFHYLPDNLEFINYEISVIFQIFNSNLILSFDPDQDTIEYKDEKFLLTVISILIGTVRGMIALKTMGMNINRVILPIMDSQKILDGIGIKNLPGSAK